MITRIHASLALALAALGPVPSSSFSRASVRPRPAFSVGSSSASPLTSSTSTSLNSHAVSSEEDAVWLMGKARECALSDTCSIDEAEGYLRDVVHVQSSCVAGTLAGPEACDVGFASEVVAALREKIEHGRVGASDVSVSNGALAIDSSPSPLQMETLAVVCLYAALVLSTATLGSMTSSSLDVSPFTAQEVWWSIRDGYFGDLVSHFMRNGGLLVGANDMTPVVPFTAQEVWWSIRDGYVGDMVSHSMRNGGLLVGANEAKDLATMPVTGEEWMWAVRDGYVGDMVSHVFRNGGI